jgi:dTMP kinase
MTAFFVTVEGPNGVGKSTVIEAMLAPLEARLGMAVHLTKEPSATVLGAAIRELEPTLTPEALALACAADRLDHLDREIEPALLAGRCVLSDRYVPSSLVLQRLDGLDTDYIWSLNENMRVPDLTLYLEDAPETIDRRVAARTRRSRFEAKATAEREIGLYREARAFLEQEGWQQEVIDCSGRAAGPVAESACELVIAALNRQGA